MIFSKNALFLLCFLIPLITLAQESQEEKVELPQAILVNFEFGYNFPGGDLNERFGNSFGAGGGIEYLTKNNFIYGLQSTFYFGNKVKDNVLSEIQNDQGFLIGNNRIHADVVLRQRGLFVGGSFGKLFSVNKYNKRSGIRTTLGLGIFQHKIRVQEDPNSFVPIIAGDYKKGWDRLSNGFSLRQFVGYQHLSNNGLVNFYIGVELMQAFTQNRREQDFKLMEKFDEKRFDMQYGFKLGWVLPFYVGRNADDIYY